MCEIYKLSKTLDRCQCCFSDVDLLNIWSEYERNGVLEIYGAMLQECFAITWQPSDFPQLICAECIARLHDAVSFKERILATQELFKEGVCIINVDAEVKIEEEEESYSQLDEFESIEYLDAGDPDEELPSTSQPTTPEPEQKKRKWPKKKIRSERNKTYKQYTQKALREAIEVVKNGDMTCVGAAKKYGIPKYTLSIKVNQDDDEEISITTQKHYKLVEELQQILTYTNAIPFKTRTTRYYCFYCSTDGPIFEEPEDLRKHTQTEHLDDDINIKNIEQFMKPHWMHEIVKIDVEGLHCNECLELLPDWNYMFTHFAEAHYIEFSEAYTRIIPYALTSQLQCFLCHKSFHNFGHVDSHMNNHYSNYICYECGDTFLAASRLDKHLKVHKVGSYKCKMCDKVFSLEKYRTKHFNLVHKQECSNKCLYCPEKFVGPFQRHVHVTEKHKEKVKMYTCEICGKGYTWKPYFLAHKRRKHATEKNYKCEFCPKKFLMQYELKEHSIKHTNEKNYLCKLCPSSFKRAISLRRHLEGHGYVKN